MTDEFANVYEDTARAEAYAGLEYPGTYYLAFRDLPAILRQHVRGDQSLDFGCGTGRSTRYLRDLGFHALGVDIAESMLAQARERDPAGEYHLVPADAPPPKVRLFRALRTSLTAHGRIVIIVSARAIYLHEWASFSTRAFPVTPIGRSSSRPAWG